MKYVISTLLIAAAIGVFFVAIDPLYGEVQELRGQVNQLNEAFSNAQQIQQARDELLSIFNAIPQEDVERLGKLLPNDVDNVKLILEINQLASQNGLGVRTIETQNMSAGAQQEAAVQAARQLPYGAAPLGLTLTGSYSAFRSFLTELDRSLRLSDVTSLSLESGGQDFNEYTIELQTYWLR